MEINKNELNNDNNNITNNVDDNNFDSNIIENKNLDEYINDNQINTSDNSLIELEHESIENLDVDNTKEEKKDGNKIEELTKKLHKNKIHLIISRIFLFIFFLFFVVIMSIMIYAYIRFKPAIKQFMGGNVNLASISYVTDIKGIDLQKFTQKLAFLDGAVELLYHYNNKDNKKLEDAMFKGYLDALDDNYSEYYPAKEFTELTEKITEGVYYGIGCVVTQDKKTKDCKVTLVYEDSPAEKGGVKVGDIFDKIDDKKVRGLPLEDLVNKIKGEEGQMRKIEVYRPDENKNVILTCYCGKVDIKLVNSEMYEDNIGYISISEFTGKAYQQFVKNIDKLQKENAKAFIIDLRNNPGGELTTVCNMLDYLIKDRDGRYTLNQKDEIFDVGKTLLVYIKEKDVVIDAIYATDNHSIELPMVILTNTSSASAAELFTAAMRDYKKATIVGMRTFGKGVVQNIIPYDDGSAFKFTVSEYFPPSGYTIDQMGILPDYSLDSDGNEFSYDDKHNLVSIDDGKKYVFDKFGEIIEEVTLSTESIVKKDIKAHVENLKIYDEENIMLEKDEFIELDNKYYDKQVLQAIIILKDKIQN